MKALLPSLKRIFFQILLLLLCYFLSRLAFTLINHHRFSGLGVAGFLRLCFYALRFDFSTIVTINALYFVMLLLPLPLWRMPRWERFTQYWFLATNTIAFAFEVSDWAYFPFTLKRATNDVLDMITRSSDFLKLLPHFLTDYWYAPIGFILLIWLFIKANNFIRSKTKLNVPPDFSMSWIIGLWQFVAMILIVGICIIGMRGGLQLIPLGNGNALQVTSNQYVPIVLNTPFSIMHSYSGKMEEVHFFSEETLGQYFPPVKQYKDRQFSKKNVVVIILESFSKEFTGIGGRKSYTPFLDSLMQHALVCHHAFANSLHSAEGIPAILSGMPSLMEEPITTSSYGTDRLTSLPALLQEEGYETAFYHGGSNGTMSFDIYASNAGFQHYYGRTEYANDRDYDGNWGIWDEPFFQYFARGLSAMKQPFMASVFSLSSHDPFKVPAKYASVLPQGSLPIHQTIAYTDLALRKFFQKASEQSWFANTLFVITADHAAPVSKDPYYSSLNMGAYSIPVIFYSPALDLHTGFTDTLFQQIDILPTVLDMLGYQKPFFAFGQSLYHTQQPRFVVNELTGSYQWYMDDFLLTANEMKPQALYDFRSDSLCKNNLIKDSTEVAGKMISRFHAFVQFYRSALIHNKLTASAYSR